jgi:hypothetical protein
MTVWFLLAIPVIACAVLVFMGKKQYLGPQWIGLFLLSALLIWAGQGCGTQVVTRDTEYWGGWLTKATYYEAWDEEVSCRHPVYETVSDGKGGTTTRYTGDEHSYDVDDHPERWEAADSNGFEHDIDEARFQELVLLWGNKTFVELNRDYHSKDGNAYETVWAGKYDTLQPAFTQQTYENRIQASSSVFNPPPVNNWKSLGLYEYPRTQGYYLSSTLPQNALAGSEHLDKMNALLGRSKQVRTWLLVYRDKPQETANKQEQFWKRGNKNELVICVSLDQQDRVQWAHVFSWTKREDLKVEVRDFLTENYSAKPLDMESFVVYLGNAIEQKWERRQFADFSYLHVEVPAWVMIVLAVVLSGATFACAIVCDASHYSMSRRSPYSGRRRF